MADSNSIQKLSRQQKKANKPAKKDNPWEIRKMGRATVVKERYPHIPDVPDKLTWSQVNTLSQQHGFNVADFRQAFREKG